MKTITIYPKNIEEPIQKIVSRRSFDIDIRNGIIRIYGERMTYEFNVDDIYKIETDTFSINAAFLKQKGVTNEKN